MTYVGQGFKKKQNIFTIFGKEAVCRCDKSYRRALSYDGQEPIRCMCCRAALDEAQCMAIVLAAPLKLMCEVLAKRIRGAAERAAHERLELEAMEFL